MSSRAEAPAPGRAPASIRVLEVAAGGLRLVERPSSTPAPDEALVAVGGCALDDAEIRDLAAADPGACVGGALHGVVVAVAAGRHRLTAGDRVVAPSLLPCGACPACRRGRGEACAAPARPLPGGLASHVRVPAHHLVALEGELARASVAGWSLAAAGSALLLAYHGLARAGLMPGELLVVAGADAVGLCAVQVAVAQGAFALVLDVDDDRLDAARRSGARGVVSCAGASPDEVATAAEEWCAAEGVATARRTVVAGAGGRESLGRGAALVQPGGALVVLGRPPRGAVVDLERLAARGATLVALRHGHPDLLVECLALCARGAVSLPAVTRRVAPEDAAAAVTALRRGEAPRIPVICFGDD